MFRTGNHWGRTLVWEGELPPDENGRRADDRLLGLLDSPELAALVAQLLNDHWVAEAGAAFLRDEGVTFVGTAAAQLRMAGLKARQVDEFLDAVGESLDAAGPAA